MSSLALTALAGLFAVVCGMNDGGALLATGLKIPSVRPVTGVLMMMAALTLVPPVAHQVALTFTTRLTTMDGPEGRLVMAIAVLSALAVVMFLSSRGRPTSLTLAIVGALTGADLGWGLPVAYEYVLFVLAVALAAPFVGALLAVPAGILLVRVARGRRLRHWHRAGFTLQCLAYAANDGQKMLAVFMLALGISGAPLSTCFAMAGLFGAGAVYGLPRAGRLLSREIIVSRPLHGVTAELSTGTAVIGCAALGAPVSMTQTIAGALIGAGMTESTGRVRWHAATKIVMAWALTLPVSGLLAAAAALIVRGLIA
ncbi:anion permease [Planobispora siamensis]|uniref:Phosphate transporter n=1 Tax=Planobispora siamensis TaxID=936338 RepID=A0A8J3SGC7_9ACTN|nr:inorganic phosphate transporter [Planobispora siamensis]GIH94061.1 phosphate transporter [Planobispora siamensis]